MILRKTVSIARIASRRHLYRTHSSTSPLTLRLCLEIVEGYVLLDEEHQQRNIIAWRPTLVEILDGFVSFSDADVTSSLGLLTWIVLKTDWANVSCLCGDHRSTFIRWSSSRVEKIFYESWGSFVERQIKGVVYASARSVLRFCTCTFSRLGYLYWGRH